MLRFRVLGASFLRFECFVFKFGCFVFEFWVLRFRDLGASFSRFGCFMLRSLFASASFSKLPRSNCMKKYNDRDPCYLILSPRLIQG